MSASTQQQQQNQKQGQQEQQKQQQLQEQQFKKKVLEVKLIRKNEYDKKTMSLKKFISQQHRYYFREDVLRAFHSDFQCAKKRIHYIEKYKIIKKNE